MGLLFQEFPTREKEVQEAAGGDYRIDNIFKALYRKITTESKQKTMK